MCILTNGKRVVGSPGHTVLAFLNSGHTVCGFYSLTPSHSVTYTLLWLSYWRCCRVDVFAGGGHISVSRLHMFPCTTCLYVSCLCKEKKSVRQLTATLHLYIPIYTFVVSFSYFSSSSFIPLILIPVSSHLTHSKSSHVLNSLCFVHPTGSPRHIPYSGCCGTRYISWMQ